MKTLKQKIVALSLILVYGTASAFDTAVSKESMPIVINSYIDAIAHGKIDKLEDIIDNRAEFTITNGTNTASYDKKAIIGLIKANQSVLQNCETSYKILESDDKRASIRVMYKYENFIRIDNISLIEGAMAGRSSKYRPHTFKYFITAKLLQLWTALQLK